MNQYEYQALDGWIFEEGKWRATNTSIAVCASSSARWILERQVLRESFEHALTYSINYEIDLRSFDARYSKDPADTAANASYGNWYNAK